MEAWLFRLALLLYFVSSAVFLAGLSGRIQGFRAAGVASLWGAVATHGAALVLHWTQLGWVGATSPRETASAVAWVLAFAYLVIEARKGLAVVGAAVAPAAFFLALGGSLPGGGAGGGELPPILQSVWLPVHVTLALFGHAVLALACATSLFYLAEDRRLKSKRPSVLRRVFPSLEKLDELSHRLLVWGFPLLTLGIVTGAMWAQSAWGTFWSWEARETFSLLTWFLYATLLHGRLLGGWRGRRAATLTVVGFAVVVLSFVGANFLFPGRHGGSYG